MGRTYLVARREFFENLRTKAFWVSILIMPLMLTLGFTVPALLSKSKDVRRYVVLDESGEGLLEAIEARAALPDLERVLHEAVRRVKRNESLDPFPAEVARIAPAIADLPDAERKRFVEIVVKTLDPARNRDEIEAARRLLGEQAARVMQATSDKFTEEVRRWWQRLEPAEARHYAPDLDRALFERLPAGGRGEEELAAMVDRGEIFAYIVIGPGVVADGSGCKYVSNNLTDSSLKRWYAGLLNDEIRHRRFAGSDVDRAAVERILAPVVLDERKIGEAGKEEAVAAKDTIRQWVPAIFSYVLWFAVLIVAQMLLTNTIEEKSNRIIEVLLSSVSSLQLMTGKIAGIAATGLTVLVSWIVFLFLAVRFLPGMLGFELGFDLTFIFRDPLYLSSFVAYFLLGYLLYAALLVGIGAVCTSLKEAQNLMMPVMVVLVMPMLAILPVSQDPNGALARLLSYIPPFTPFIMMNRSAGPPSAMEYIVTTLLLVASLVAAFWAAAKVFRIGILMTGKRPRIVEILRWIRRAPDAAPSADADT